MGRNASCCGIGVRADEDDAKLLNSLARGQRETAYQVLLLFVSIGVATRNSTVCGSRRWPPFSFALRTTMMLLAWGLHHRIHQRRPFCIMSSPVRLTMRPSQTAGVSVSLSISFQTTRTKKRESVTNRFLSETKQPERTDVPEPLPWPLFELQYNSPYQYPYSSCKPCAITSVSVQSVLTGKCGKWGLVRENVVPGLKD